MCTAFEKQQKMSYLNLRAKNYIIFVELFFQIFELSRSKRAKLQLDLRIVCLFSGVKIQIKFALKIVK